MPDLALLLNPNILHFYDPLGHAHEIPEPGIFDAPAVNLCINSIWAGHIGGMIARLLPDDAWQGDDAERLAAVNEILKLLNALGDPDNIGECNMANGCCDENQTNYRINSDGVPQVSSDGGQTWEEMPEFGSPLNPRSYFPPVTGETTEDIRCKVANSVTWFFHNLQKQYHAALVAEVEQLALVTIFEGALLIIGIIPFSLISIVGTTIALLVAQKNATDFEAEFPSEFWDKLCEAAYCDVDAAGVYINTDARQIIDDVIASYGASYATEWLNRVMGVFSGAALTNTGAAGFDEGISCEGFCVEECNNLSEWVSPSPGVLGTIDDVTETEITGTSNFYAGFGLYTFIVNAGHPEDFDICCTVSNIFVDDVEQAGAHSVCPCGEDGYTTDVNNQTTPTLEVPINLIRVDTGGASATVRIIFHA